MRQQTAAADEVHASVCRWLLQECLDKMTASDIVACIREILKARSGRNKAVEQLAIGTLDPSRFYWIRTGTWIGSFDKSSRDNAESVIVQRSGFGTSSILQNRVEKTVPSTL
jgi:hypothetical protein